MKLLASVDLKDLIFPAERWNWLRAPFEVNASAPDLFVWGYQVGEKIIAWGPQGNAPLSLDHKLPVFLLNPDASPKLSTTDDLIHQELCAFGLYLKTSFQAQAPQDVEWVNALIITEQTLGHDFTEKGLAPYWDQALKAAGQEPHISRIATRMKFSFLSVAERQFLFQKKWDPAYLEFFEHLPLVVREAALRCFLKYNISANSAREISNFLMINQKRYGEQAVLNILGKEHKSSEEFRHSLFCLAQPELARLADERVSMLRGLRIPPRTSVFGDPSFEKDILKITHTPRVTSDWESFKDWVNNAETTKKIDELLDLYQ